MDYKTVNRIPNITRIVPLGNQRSVMARGDPLIYNTRTFISLDQLLKVPLDQLLKVTVITVGQLLKVPLEQLLKAGMLGLASDPLWSQTYHP